MPRPWRTVYESPHKQVRIRPHNNRQTTRKSAKDFTGLIGIAAGLIIFLALVFFMAEFWPFIIVALALGGLKSRCRR